MNKKASGMKQFYKSELLKKQQEQKFIRRLKGTAMRPGANEIEEFKRGEKPQKGR